MDVKTQTVTSPDLAREAEALLQSLAGVAHARVHAGPRGIDAIHVVAADANVAPQLAGHVRSALLAGLATPILPARIHVRAPADHSAQPDLDDAATPFGAGEDGTARQRIRLLTSEPIDPESRAVDGERRLVPDDAAPTQAATDKPRLVSVDLERPDQGRILCRVTVTHRARVHAAEALAVDLPGAAAHAAAQATVHALVEAGIMGLQLDGLREVEIAGRNYAVVALRRNDSSLRLRAGTAPITGAPERAAANAAVAAARDLI